MNNTLNLVTTFTECHLFCMVESITALITQSSPYMYRTVGLLSAQCSPVSSVLSSQCSCWHGQDGKP